jgi:hypothetical protein
VHFAAGFFKSRFYEFGFSQTVVFSNSWFYAWPFGSAKWPKRPAKPVSSLPNRDFGKLGFPNQSFHKSRSCEIVVLVKSTFSNTVLQNLFCPCKTDSAWANRRSRFAVRLRLGFSNHGFMNSVFLKSGFCQTIVLQNHGLTKPKPHTATCLRRAAQKPHGSIPAVKAGGFLGHGATPHIGNGFAQ